MRARAALTAFTALLFVFPALAEAGTVTQTASAITYTADPATQAPENLELGFASPFAFVTSEVGVTTTDPECTETGPNRVDCDPAAGFIVNLLGFNDRVGATQVTGPMTLEARGNGGDDQLSGTLNADRLFGGDGGDSLDGSDGNDTIDGGAGADYLTDGAGDDSVAGGPNDDSLTAGTGRDGYSGGDGADTIDYSARTAPVTVTMDGQADDGEAGEGDNAGTDIESATGGSGNDRIVAGPAASYLFGGAGNDSITAGAGEQRVEGNEGDDTIDTRDGAYDSIDCGAGNDTLYADPSDGQTGCEVAPDRDGDGTLNEQDCEPDNAAVHPGAGEVFGNASDEDCAGGPGYFKVEAGIVFKTAIKKHPYRARWTRLALSNIRAGDKITVRCRTKAKGCPFKVKTRIGSDGQPTVKLVSLFKKRYLKVGAVVEVTVTRPLHHGKVFRLRVGKKAGIQPTFLCVLVGKTAAEACPTVG